MRVCVPLTTSLSYKLLILSSEARSAVILLTLFAKLGNSSLSVVVWLITSVTFPDFGGSEMRVNIHDNKLNCRPHIETVY